MLVTTIFENGRIHTLDPERPTVSALAVRGERIVATGDVEACRDAAGAGAHRVDLGGAVVVPGLIDSHIHTAQYARGLDAVDLRDTASLDEALERVRAHAATLPAGAWVSGGRWDCHRWAVPVQPNRRDLDRVTPDRPVALPSIDGHTTWVNSKALEILGIDRRTADPAGGQIVRDEHGEATGILRETAAQRARALATENTTDELAAQLRKAMSVLLSHGLTGIHDIDGADALAAFRSLRETDDLPVRVHKLIPRADLSAAIDAGWATGDGDRWIRTGPVKLFVDGALGSHTCLMSHGYADEPDNHGMCVTPYPELLELVSSASDAGIATAAHAIGDEANHLVLKAFAEVIERRRSAPMRFRIEHAQFIQPADVPMLAKLGVIASMQPTHCTSDIPLSDTMLGDPDLLCYGWATLLESGAAVAFGSDAPVENPNPWHGLHAAVTRQRNDATPDGGWQPHERLSLDTALRSYTVAPAYASYEEHLKGRLREGMLADFIVLDADPFAPDADPLHQMTVRTTVVGGAVRWSA